MLSPALPPLDDWGNFYVITGSSAAALTGLMFVVIALTAEARAARGADAIHAFSTPTVVHFGAVLLLAAILTTPRQTVPSLSLCLGACGLAGLAYIGSVVARMRRQKDYIPVLADWLWYGLLPAAGYAIFGGAAAVLWRHPGPALYAVGAAALLLLYVGIHNAWDAALFIAVDRRAS